MSFISKERMVAVSPEAEAAWQALIARFPDSEYRPKAEQHLGLAEELPPAGLARGVAPELRVAPVVGRIAGLDAPGDQPLLE